MCRVDKPLHILSACMWLVILLLGTTWASAPGSRRHARWAPARCAPVFSAAGAAPDAGRARGRVPHTPVVQRTCAGEHAPAAAPLLLAWTEVPSVVSTLGNAKATHVPLPHSTQHSTHSALHRTGAQQCCFCKRASPSTPAPCVHPMQRPTVGCACACFFPMDECPRAAMAPLSPPCPAAASEARSISTALAPATGEAAPCAAPARPALREPGPQAAACLGRRRDAHLGGRQLVSTSCAGGAFVQAPALSPRQALQRHGNSCGEP